MSYLLVLVVEAAGGLVPPPAGGVLVLSPQPVSSAPANRLNRTNRTYVLFIVGVRFTGSARKTSMIFNLFLAAYFAAPLGRKPEAKIMADGTAPTENS